MKANACNFHSAGNDEIMTPRVCPKVTQINQIISMCYLHPTPHVLETISARIFIKQA